MSAKKVESWQDAGKVDIRASTREGSGGVPGKGRIRASAEKVRILVSTGKVESGRVPKKGRNRASAEKVEIQASTEKGRIRASARKVEIQASTEKGRIRASAGKVEIWASTRKVESGRVPEKGLGKHRKM